MSCHNFQEKLRNTCLTLVLRDYLVHKPDANVPVEHACLFSLCVSLCCLFVCFCVIFRNFNFIRGSIQLDELKSRNY